MGYRGNGLPESVHETPPDAENPRVSGYPEARDVARLGVPQIPALPEDRKLLDLEPNEAPDEPGRRQHHRRATRVPPDDPALPSLETQLELEVERATPKCPEELRPDRSGEMIMARREAFRRGSGRIAVGPLDRDPVERCEPAGKGHPLGPGRGPDRSDRGKRLIRHRHERAGARIGRLDPDPGKLPADRPLQLTQVLCDVRIEGGDRHPLSRAQRPGRNQSTRECHSGPATDPAGYRKSGATCQH